MASPPDTQAPPPGETAMASPAHGAQPPAGSGKLWGTWELSGGNLAARGSGRDDIWGEHGFTCYRKAICECTLDEVRDG